MNMIRLWAVAVFVSLGLLAMPVAVADTSGKAALSAEEQTRIKDDLFTMFDQEDKTLFASLPFDKQERVLSYYAEGRKEPPNKKKFYKGVVNLMRYYRDIVTMDNILTQLSKTGKLPDGDHPSIGISAQIATNGFSGGSRYVDLNKANQFDELVIDLLKKDVADMKKDVADMKKDVADIEKRVAKLQKDIDQLQAFLKALDQYGNHEPH